MFNFFKKDDDPIISFVSTNSSIAEIEETKPKPANLFYPDWWNSIPRKIKHDDSRFSLTAKACPSFKDYFSNGFILPAWEDTKIKYDSVSDTWNVEESDARAYFEHDWTIHGQTQFLDHVSVKINNLQPTMIFKANSPWRIITKPGWSVMQVPLFYHFNNDFTAIPGIIDTDILHEANIQLLYFGDGKEITIKRGQPLAQYIPFKRESHSYEVRYQTESDVKKVTNSLFSIHSKFVGSGAYRMMQKERDKNATSK